MNILQALFLLFMLPVIMHAQEESILVGTTTRTMITYAPDGLEDNCPLMISLHGANQDPAFQQNQSKWENVADTAQFVVVYPHGVGNFWDISGDSDIDFITTIIDEMYDRYGIDRNRVYLSGFSMGGMMTYYAATKIADKIAAFAPVSGYLMSGPNATSSRPIPIIHTHGTSDDVVLYSGVQACMDAWVARNNCTATPVVTDPYPASNVNLGATKTYWGDGDDNVEVALMTIEGKGHWWSLDVAAGIHTSAEIWKFCRKYSLDPGRPQINITSPTHNSEFTTLNTISLTADATDTDGNVTKVEFFIDNVSVYAANIAPFTFEWTQPTLGQHKIKAEVTDNDDKTNKMSITVSVKEPQTPALQQAEPENNAFNLPATIGTFTFTYNEEVDCSVVEAVLTGSGEPVILALTETGMSSELTFTVPSGVSLSEGEYSLSISNVSGSNGIVSEKPDVVKYIIGAPSPSATTKTIYSGNWNTDDIIPNGWKVTYGANVREQNTGFSSGPRLMKFQSGGDFEYGMYLRDEGDVCHFSYGLYNDNKLVLAPGFYALSFYYSWWTAGAASANRKIHLNITDTYENLIYQQRDLSTNHGFNDNRDVVVNGSQLHTIYFSVTKEQAYIIELSTEQFGWDGAIIGGVELILQPVSTMAAENITLFTNALSAANLLNAEIIDAKYDGSEKTDLQTTIDTYTNETFTDVTSYQAATEAIIAAIDAMTAKKAAVDDIACSIVSEYESMLQIKEIQYYSILGVRIEKPHTGFCIVKTIYEDGSSTAEKRMFYVF